MSRETIFFCRHQAQDLRQIRMPRNLTTRQSAANYRYVLKCAPTDSRFPVHPAPQRNKSPVPGSACSSSFMRHWESRSESPIHARWRAANRPTTTTQHHGRPAACGERTWLRQPSKEFVVDRIARGKSDRRPSQNLPPTAIYCHFVAAKPIRPFQPLHSFVAPRGRVGQPGPRAENRERAVTSLNFKPSSRADLSITEESADGRKLLF